MEDIRFYNFEFQRLHVEPNVISANWRSFYNAVGQFEAHFPLSSDALPLVGGEPYLVAVQGKRAAVVTGWTASSELTVFGRSCNWLLGKRIVPKIEQVTDSAENIARALAAEAFSDAGAFALGELCGGTGEITFSRAEPESLLECVCACLKMAGAGHKVVFDPVKGQWIFRVKMGKSLPLVLSEENRNAAELEFSEDCLERYGSGWYRRAPDAAEAGQDAEWVRLERGEKTGIYRWECLLSAENQAEAEQELALESGGRSAAAKSVGLICGEDYELGDTVEIRMNKENFYRSHRMRVTGVHSWWEDGIYGEEPIMEEWIK